MCKFKVLSIINFWLSYFLTIIKVKLHLGSGSQTFRKKNCVNFKKHIYKRFRGHRGSFEFLNKSVQSMFDLFSFPILSIHIARVIILPNFWKQSISIFLCCLLINLRILSLCPGIIQANLDFEMQENSLTADFFSHILISCHVTASKGQNPSKVWPE